MCFELAKEVSSERLEITNVKQVKFDSLVKLSSHYSFMNNLVCTYISHNPFVTCFSNFQKKHQVKDSENYKL